MGDGQNPNDIGMKDVGDVVGKDLQIDPAIATGTNTGQLGLIRDSKNNSPYFVFKANAQPGFNGFIAGDGIGKLSSRVAKNP